MKKPKALWKAWVAMHCAIGSNRVVVSFERRGFVIKLPIMHFKLAVKIVKNLLCESRFCLELLRQFLLLFTLPVDLTEVGGVKTLLFKGIADNWREFWFFVVGRHPFAYPTYFSLFGLVTVQKKGTPLEMSREEFGRQVKSIIGEEKFYFDGHHFSNPANFCFSKGRLQIVDYGSPKSRKIIREVGMCLYNNFRINE